MYCPKCGTENDDNNKFCTNCGNTLQGIASDRDAVMRERGGGDTFVHQRVFEEGDLIGDSGRYKIEKYIGEGGMGIVYKAYDKTLDIPVAIKFLPAVMSQNPRSVKDFQREAQAAVRLNHRNIVRVYNFDQFEGDYFITMEFIDGPTLLDLIVEKAPMSADDASELIEQICDGLAYAHERKVYHRDIKPANIMLNSSDVVKITDFGIARVVKDTTMSHSNRTLDTSGTLAYMSPEQIRGKKTDERSDLYSLGIVLYEMFTGYPPFRGGDLTYQHLNEKPEWVEDVPAEVNSIVMKCLEKKPSARYASADDLRKAIRTKPEEIKARDGAEMLLIPAGEFEMGIDSDEIPQLVNWVKKWYFEPKASWFEDETPRHTVYLDAFWAT